jgi:HD-GYP domain-containing protein (c-di-GMP phosphodiesterase class II)
MVSARPYRGALTPASVHKHVVQLAGKHFDPVVVAAFTRVLSRMGEIPPELALTGTTHG